MLVKRVELNELKSEIEELRNSEKVFWTIADLKNQTGIKSFVSLQKLFYQPGFPKFKIGNEWRFPVDETSKWLKEWWRAQPIG